MFAFRIKKKKTLDVDPRRDDDASPMSSYRCLLRPTWVISSLWHKSKYNSKFNFELKKKTSQTKYNSKFNFELKKKTSENKIQVKIQFRIFLKKKKKQIFMFPCCSTREDLSIDVSITIVGLILTKLGWFQHFRTSQNSNFKLFWKIKSNFWVSMHGVVLVKTFPM